MNKILKFFDKFEDKVRGRLSRVPILYAIVGGMAIVLFWRGAWTLADDLASLGGVWAFIFDPINSLIISVFILLVTGLFVSFFIGDRIILSGLTHEKKLEEKTEAEVREEELELQNVMSKLNHLERKIEEIISLISK
ncbi:MAG: hypothetical protein EXS46_00785 [Candidatus Taylorbacteria bacterium]|nr:hypothetical protein [Candidatus Taylorbacteria bacterium]